MNTTRSATMVAMSLLGFLFSAAIACAAFDAETKTKAESGDADAMIELAKAYEQGDGVQKNLVIALDWYRKATEVAPWSAAAIVGEWYEKGRGTKPDPVMALHYYLRYTGSEAAIARLLAADPQLSQKLETVAPAETKAILAKAAQGDAEARYDLAQLLLGESGGLMRDEAKGLQLMQQSADQGYAPAEAWIGTAYGFGQYHPQKSNGDPFFLEDLAKGLAWTKKAAAQKHPGACYDLGVYLFEGEGVTHDYAEAHRLLDIATQGEIEYAEYYRDKVAEAQAAMAEAANLQAKAEGGDAAAQLAYAQQLQQQKNTKALDWFLRAATNQNADEVTRNGADLRIQLIIGPLQAAALAGNAEKQEFVAEILQKWGRTQEAREMYDKVLANPKSSDALKMLATDGKSHLTPSSGVAAEKVVPPAELKTKAEAGDALAQYDYAMELKKKGDLDGASAWFHKALENPTATEEVKKWADMQVMGERQRYQSFTEREAAAKKKQADDAAEAEKKAAWEKLHPADKFYGMFDFWRKLPKFRDVAMTNLLEAAKVAETGTPEVQYRLAEFIMQGTLGVPKDEARARALIVSSAAEGFAPAKLVYANGLLTGHAGFTVDEAKGHAMLTELVTNAETIAPEARHQVALLLFKGGLGVTADPPRALKLLEQNAEAGFVLSQYEFGRALLTGIPGQLAADPARGVEYLKRAANQGLPMAMALLGQVFEQGVGAVAADPAQAMAWYEKAEQSGMPQAKAAADRVRAKLPAPTPTEKP